MNKQTKGDGLNKRKNRCVNRCATPSPQQVPVPQGEEKTAQRNARGSKQGKQRQVWKDAAHWACGQCPGGSGREGRQGRCTQGRTGTPGHPPARAHTRGHSLLAAARPVMGIYFPQLCALVPSLSSSAQCSQANERLPVMK